MIKKLDEKPRHERGFSFVEMSGFGRPPQLFENPTTGQKRIMNKTRAWFVCWTSIFAACTYFGELQRDGVTRYSVMVTQNGAQNRLVTRISLAGEPSSVDIVLGTSTVYSSANKFTLSEIGASLADMSIRSPIIGCSGQIDMSDFAKMISRLSSHLQPLPTIDDVQFEIIPTPLNMQYRSKFTSRINQTVPIRLAFAVPRNTAQCRAWWLHVLGTFVHEYTHAYLVLNNFDPPNLVSEEVIAYSMMRCALLAIATPEEINLNAFNMPDENMSFDDIYSLILSTEGVDASAYGKGLADLHFFELLGRSINSEPTHDQELDLEKYCRTIATVPIDFRKQSYFDVVDAPAGVNFPNIASGPKISGLTQPVSDQSEAYVRRISTSIRIRQRASANPKNV